MTTRFKDFGAGKNSGDKAPLNFKIHDELFDCVPEVQGKLMLDLTLQTSDETPGATAKFMNTFFEQVLTEESFVRFNALLTDKYRIVSVDTLSEIIGWLIEEYTDRPEEQPELSSAGE